MQGWVSAQCWVTRYEDVQHLVDQAMRMHGRIDVIINNAGLTPS